MIQIWPLTLSLSRSGADLYVTKHLDAYLRKSSNSQSLLLRILSKDRHVYTVPESVRKYCCFSPDGSTFEVPPDHVVRQHRVVVTTVEMSLHLTTMKLKGNFTHIFIDEAAQMLECETVMPLTLATDKTCVVLTGDHIQISPKVCFFAGLTLTGNFQCFGQTYQPLFCSTCSQNNNNNKMRECVCVYVTMIAQPVFVNHLCHLGCHTGLKNGIAITVWVNSFCLS